MATLPDPKLSRLLAAVQQAQRAGDPAAAERALRALLADYPAQPQALNSLGSLRLPHDPEEAAALFARAAEHDPHEPTLRNNLAEAHRRAGRPEEALAACEAALSLHGYYLPALVKRAQLLEALGREGHALDAWKLALTAAPPAEQRSPQLAALLDGAAAKVRAEGEALAAALEPAMRDAPPRIAHAAGHMTGRRRIFTHQPTGLHVPRLPADEFFDRALFPWMDALEAAAPAITAELNAVMAADEGVEPYVAYRAGTPVNQWAALNHSRDWSAAFLQRDGAARPLLDRCPATAAALAAVPGRLDVPGRGPTAFFSVLKAGARIPPHTGATNARAIVHLGLKVPAGCGFRVGSETRGWEEKSAFAFDDTIEHEAWNDADDWRAVLIFDVWNPHLDAAEREALRRLFAGLDAHRPGGGLFD